MTDILVDGNIKVSWLTACASIAAPTTTELNAGLSLENFITPTGLAIKSTTASVDTSSAASTFTTMVAGRRSFDITVEFKRQEGSDAVYDALPYKTAGFLVVRRTLPSDTAWASGQELEVYPIITGEPEMTAPAVNEVQKWTSPMMVSDDPATRAVVA